MYAIRSYYGAAVKAVFAYRKVDIRSVLLVTDLENEAALAFKQNVQRFLQHPAAETERTFFLINGSDYHTTNDLLELLPKYSPDLICTYRNLV